MEIDRRLGRLRGMDLAMPRHLQRTLGESEIHIHFGLVSGNFCLPRDRGRVLNRRRQRGKGGKRFGDQTF